MKENVDLLLVNPGNRLEQFAALNELATVAPPLGIAVIAAFVREAGHSVAIVDAEAEFLTPEQTMDRIEEYDPKMVGLSAFTTKMTAAGKTLALVKERMPHVKTVVGGHHPSVVPERTLREEAVDFVIKGEGYFPTLALLTELKKTKPNFNIEGVWYLKDGKVIDNGRAKGIKNLDDLPFAAWDLLPMEKYRAHHWQVWDKDLDQSHFAVLHTSLGCPFDCDYCSVNVVYGKHSTRYRGVSKVVDEMEMLVDTYGIRNLEIIDDTFTINPKRVESLCDEIISRGLGDKLNMWCFARTNTVSPELMSKMKMAGFNWVFMGFESGNDMVLQGVDKRQTISQIESANKIVHDTGIHVGGNYVFGLPGDTQETMEQTFDLAQKLNTEYANFFVVMAYPGTKLHDNALRKGYPLPDTWGQYGFFAPDALPLRNEHLSAKEILIFRDNAFRQYFTGERYQTMVRDTFGQKALNYLNEKVLVKNISRTRL